MILHFSHIGLTDGRTFMVPFGLDATGWLWLPVRLPLPSRDAGRRLAAPNATSEYSAHFAPRSVPRIDLVYRSGGLAFDIGR
jgi:hypothetical protein